MDRFPLKKSEEEWKKELSDKEFRVRQACGERHHPTAAGVGSDSHGSLLSRRSRFRRFFPNSLAPLAVKVIRGKGTEPARTGEYDKFYPEKGYFVCRACKQPLYTGKGAVCDEHEIPSMSSSGCSMPCAFVDASTASAPSSLQAKARC